MLRRVRILAALLAVVLAVVAAACAESGSESEGDEAAFYDGETVRIIVPYEPGGGFDTYARGLAPYLEQQLEGARVVVENVPGAGGLLGANETFRAQDDGLTIGLINFPGAVFAEATAQPGVEFANSDWRFLARVAAVNPLIYTATQSEYETAEDLIEAEQPVTFGLGGVGSDSYYGTIAIAETLAFPYDLVTGYAGSGEADAALVAGEIDASFNSVDSAMPLIEAGDAVPVMLVGNERSDALDEVPTIVELADGEQEDVLRSLASVYELERVFVTGPDVPDERVAALGDALLAALEDPEFQSDMEQAERSLDVLGREETQALADDVVEGLDALRPLLAEAAA